jgi:hypothetical protein
MIPTRQNDYTNSIGIVLSRIDYCLTTKNFRKAQIKLGFLL